MKGHDKAKHYMEEYCIATVSLILHVTCVNIHNNTHDMEEYCIATVSLILHVTCVNIHNNTHDIQYSIHCIRHVHGAYNTHVQ